MGENKSKAVMSEKTLRKDGTYDKKYLAGLDVKELIELKAVNKGKPVQEGSVDLELAKRLSTSPPDTLWRGALRYRDAWKQWHARQFVLTPHALTYYKDKESKPEGRMLLAQCVALERKSKKEAHCFKISHRSKKKVHKGARMNSDYLILAADSTDAAASWLAALQVAINHTSADEEGARKAAATPAPNLDTLSVPAVAPEDSESETQLEDDDSLIDSGEIKRSSTPSS